MTENKETNLYVSLLDIAREFREEDCPHRGDCSKCRFSAVIYEDTDLCDILIDLHKKLML